MARLNNASNAKQSKKYEGENRRARNKAKKQAKHLKKLAYFTRRKEAKEV